MIAKVSAPILLKAFQECGVHLSQIHGFYCSDTKCHWVEDCSLDKNMRVRWTTHGADSEYNKIHALKMEEVERLKMQIICEWLYENSPVKRHDI